MDITIDETTKHTVEKAAQYLGVNENEIGQRALSYYLSALKADLELADEFSAWEQVSDDALLDMERQFTDV
jgi:hypothetical protein